MGLEGGAGNERVQVIIYNGIKFLFSKSEFKIIRELRTRLNSLKAENSMRSSFDVSDFLEEKEFDIIGKTYKGKMRKSFRQNKPYLFISKIFFR